MSGTILQNLSTKKLVVILTCLLLLLITCFLATSLNSPTPNASQRFVSIVCVDNDHLNRTTRWFYARGKGACAPIDSDLSHLDTTFDPNKLVFVYQMPYVNGDYSRWQQNLLGLLEIEFVYEAKKQLKPITKILLDMKLAYRNKNDSDNDWKLYASSIEERYVTCHIDQDERKKGGLYSCSFINLFELGSLFHDYYLLNIRLPVDSILDVNTHYHQITDMTLTTIHANGGFTRIWIVLESIFFALTLSIVYWFWRRVKLLPRSPVFLERMIFGLSLALLLLNVPFEIGTLFFNVPAIHLFNDIRQGIFTAFLLSFWLIFAGEHMLIQDSNDGKTLATYWKHLSAVFVTSIALLMFDLCERGVQLINPFHTIWVSPMVSNVALGFIYLAISSSLIYFVYLTFLIWKVYSNVRVKRSSLPSMSTARRIYYENVIYRFNFLMLATLFCAAITVSSFFFQQYYEGKLQFSEHIELELSSAYFIGLYCLWNIYIYSLLILYAPSHKKWTNNLRSENGVEDIEFRNLTTVESSSIEIASLIKFAKKTQIE